MPEAAWAACKATTRLKICSGSGCVAADGPRARAAAARRRSLAAKGSSIPIARILDAPSRAASNAHSALISRRAAACTARILADLACSIWAANSFFSSALASRARLPAFLAFLAAALAAASPSRAANISGAVMTVRRPAIDSVPLTIRAHVMSLSTEGMRRRVSF